MGRRTTGRRSGEHHGSAENTNCLSGLPIRCIRMHSFGWHYLSNAACKRRAAAAVRRFRAAADHATI